MHDLAAVANSANTLHKHLLSAPALRELSQTGKVARVTQNNESSEQDFPAQSPCINVCRLDANGLCVGCLRTLNEIAEWSRATNVRRHEILKAIKLRTAGGAVPKGSP
jgi:hypothetical protein